jgi:hypothetical protein
VVAGIFPAALYERVAHQGLCYIGTGLVCYTLAPSLLLIGALAGSRSAGVVGPPALSAGAAGTWAPLGPPALGTRALLGYPPVFGRGGLR